MSLVASVLSAGVLVVDDDDGVLRLASDALAGEGFEVVSMQSGAAALHHLNEGFRPGVVVTSIRMPGISGIELAGAIHDLSPTTSFVFMSESARCCRQSRAPQRDGSRQAVRGKRIDLPRPGIIASDRRF